MALIEGNVFENVVTPLLSPKTGQVFASPDTNTNQVCSSYLEHACQLNAFGSSGSLPGTDENFLTNFKGKSIASVGAASTSPSSKAGVGKI